MCVGRGERREDGSGDSVFSFFDFDVFFWFQRRAGSDVSINRPKQRLLRYDGQAACRNSVCLFGKDARHARDVSNALGDGRKAGRRGVEHTEETEASGVGRSGGTAPTMRGVLSGKGRERAFFQSITLRERERAKRASDAAAGESQVEKTRK